jgi:D-2-hydroxyglutarate dehydrogenase
LNGNVIGLEAVIPSGEILSDLKALRKDNTGLNLKQLFIGSEGILGVITKVALLLAPKPSSVHAAFLGCTSYEKVVKALTLAKSSLGEILSAFEFIDSPSMEIILKRTPRTRKPLTSAHNFYILIETSGSHFESDKAKMEHFLESAVESDLITDGVVAQDTSQSENFWRIREGGLLALRKEAVELHQFDFSLRIPEMYNFVEIVREKVGNAGRVTAYGHVGDGNLHLYVLGDGKNNLENVIYPFLYEEIQRRNGSISAEHGIGLFKQGMIGYTKSETNIKYMVRDI